MENTEKPASTDAPITQSRDSWWIWLIRYAKRTMDERKAKKQKEPTTDRAARVAANATVWIAIFTFVSVAVSVGTFVILRSQLREMHDGGVDTHNLAEAAGKQADAAYAQIRPWLKVDDVKLRKGVGPIKTLMFHWPEPPHNVIPPQIQVKVSTINVGYTVAQNAKVFPELFFAAFESQKWHDVVLQEEKRWCDSIAARDDPGTTAIVFPNSVKTWDMSVGGVLPKNNEPLAAALILCVNYTGSNRHQTQAWYGLYENNSVFINTRTGADSSSLRLIREENGDHAY